MPESILIMLIVLGSAAVIAVVAYIIYKIIHPKFKDDEERNKINEEQAVKEELDRYLQPIEDEETAKQVSEYHENIEGDDDEFADNANEVNDNGEGDL